MCIKEFFSKKQLIFFSFLILNNIGIKAQCDFKIPTLTSPNAKNAIFHDFDNDGNVDYVSFAFFQLDYKMGTGTNDFNQFAQGGTLFNPGTLISSITSLDFNNDSKMDIAVASSNSVILLQNNGNFSFTPVYSTTITNVIKVIGKDINNDNNPDLFIIGSQGQYNVQLGQGNGNFIPLSVVSLSVISTTTDLCDFNGDNILDLLTICSSCSNNNQVNLYYGSIGGIFTFASSSNINFNNAISNLVTGDFNNDSKNDYATILSSSSLPLNINIRFGNGLGGFPTNISVADENITSLKVKDMDNDNLPDLIYLSNDREIKIKYNNGSSGFLNGASLLSIDGTISIELPDVNNDNLPDLFVTESINGASLIITNLGNKNFKAVNTYTSNVFCLNSLDVNNDGFKDIVGSTVNGIQVLFNNTSTSFTSQATYTTNYISSSDAIIRIADVNNDGYKDIIKSCGTLVCNIDIFLGTAAGTYSNNIYLSGSANIKVMELGDFNNDNNIDIITLDITQNLTLYSGNGNGTFNVNTIVLPNMSSALLVDDFNNDNNKDIAIGWMNNMDMILGNGNGTFQAPITKNFPFSGASPNSLKSYDFNNDGKKDILAKRQVGNQTYLQLLLGNGDGSFNYSTPYFYSVTGSGSFSNDMILMDFNSDSNMDVVIISNNQAILGILNNGTQFVNGSSWLGVPVKNVYSMIEEDLNNDNKPDLAASSYLNGKSLLVPILRSNFINNTAVSNANICSGKSATLSVNTSQVTNWYATATSSNIIGSGSQFITPVLTTGSSASTFTFYPEIVNTVCTPSVTRIAITVTVQNCVWPGDLDYDLSVSNTDLFPLGIYFGQTGNSRINPSINWIGQKSNDWSFAQANFYNGKHVDSDGNGIISLADTLAITSNYNLLHVQKSQFITTQTCSNNPIYLTFNKTLYYPADTILCNINYGYQSTLQNCYGVAFDLCYDKTLVKSINTGIESTNSWLGNNLTEKINFNKIDNNAGMISSSQVRLDHFNKTGYGKLITYKFVLNDTLLVNKMGFSLKNVIKIDSLGITAPVSACVDSINIVQGIVGLKEFVGIDTNYSIMPNPFTDIIQINSSNKVEDLYIEILDLTGRIILKEKLNKSKQVNLHQLSNGTYIIKVNEYNNKPQLFKIIKQ